MGRVLFPEIQCRVEGCDRPVLIKSRRLCRPHYIRWQRHGDPLAGYRLRPPGGPEERFDALIDRDGSGCWLWTGTVGSHGYGLLSVEGRMTTAHRFSYERFVGPIPTDLQIDHLCRVRRCVNPEHLEAVTQAENIRRGEARFNSSRRAAQQTHCKNGHEFTPENTYVYGTRRHCRSCRREAVKRRYWRLRSA